MKILVPTDFSEASEQAVRYAIDLALKLSARVTLLHVFVPPMYPVGPDGAAFFGGPELFAEMVRASDAQFDRLLTRVRREGVEIDKRTGDGPTAAAIAQTARNENFDMIIMGTHGRTGLKHLLLGSVAELVVRTSTTPVLTVRLPNQVASSPFAAPPIM